jgi:hypothetical protein
MINNNTEKKKILIKYIFYFKTEIKKDFKVLLEFLEQKFLIWIGLGNLD